MVSGFSAAVRFFSLALLEPSSLLGDLLLFGAYGLAVAVASALAVAVA